MEIEAKYSVPGREVFEQLLDVRRLGAYALREAGVQDLSDRYLDTARRAVMGSGYALRLREGQGDTWRGTLKGLGTADGAVHQREEYEQDVAPDSLPEAWPAGPVRERAMELAGGEPLAGLAAVDQRRYLRKVMRGKRQVAEMSLDEVTLAGGNNQQVSWELEIELGPDGRLDDLAALNAALAGYALAAQPLSKLERALALAEAASAPPARSKLAGVTADALMTDAGRKILRLHFERMLAEEAGARAGIDPEAVHDMRVAIRRQRAALILFADFFKPKAVRPIRIALRDAARALGEVRDLDVQMEAARDYQAKLAPEDAAAFQPLLDAWAAARAAARDVLLTHLDSRAYRKFTASYARFLDRQDGQRAGRGGLPEPVLVRQALPPLLWAHYSRVRAYEMVLPGAPVPVLHALRIEAKRLRYALEFFSEVLPEIAPAIASVVALQDHLGLLQDAEVTRDRVTAFVRSLDRSRQQKPVRRALKGYLEAQSAVLRRQQETVDKPWRPVLSRRFRRRLAKAAATL